MRFTGIAVQAEESAIGTRLLVAAGATGSAGPRPAALWRDPLVLGLLVLAVIGCGWYGLDRGGVGAQVRAFWLIQAGLDAGFVALTWRIAGLAGTLPANRRFWRATSAAAGLVLAGDTWQAIVTLRQPTMASVAGGGPRTMLVAAGAVVCVLAMIAHPARVYGLQRLRFGLDAGIVMAGAGAFIWYFTLSDAVDPTSTDLGALLVSSGMLLVCTFSLVKMLLGGNAPVTRTAGIIGGVGAGLVALATALGPMLAASAYPNAGLAARLVPGVLLVVGARILQRQLRADPDVVVRRGRRPYSRLPYVAVVASQGLLFGALSDGRLTPRVWGVIVGAAAVTGLVVARQLVALQDNGRLLDRLADSTLTLRRQEERFRSLVQHAADLTMIMNDDESLSYASPALRHLLGIDPERAAGRLLWEFLHRDDVVLLRRTIERLRATPGGSATIQVRMRHHDGSLRWLGTTMTNLLDNPSVAGIVCNARNITEAVEFQERLRFEATHDPLTGLANRALFDERLGGASTVERKDASWASVLIVDLDDFKQVNDTLGHHVGDALLMEAAGRLRRNARAGDTVARLGDDEFAVLLPVTTADAGAAVARRILDAFAEPVLAHGHQLEIRASIGVATGFLTDVESLLHAADAAMFTAKRGGKGTVAVAKAAPGTDAALLVGW